MASTGDTGQRAANTARRAADSRWIERTARIGLAARGLVYVLIGILAFQIAFVNRAERADQQGAFQTLAQNGFGKAVLWLGSFSALSAMASGRPAKPPGVTVPSAMTASVPPAGSSRPSRP